ncbi:MAG: acetate kinase [Ruthenibacterium sp.]
MKILVINCGSSSLKYQLIDMTDESVLCKGNCERIGMGGSFITHKTAAGKEWKEVVRFHDHTAAFLKVVEMMTKGEGAVIADKSEISAVGHRIAQGAERFTKSELVTDAVLDTIEEIAPLAPLHNPAELQGVRSAQAVFGAEVPNTVVFDTTFHATMPAKAYMYAIPYEYYEKYAIRRYGFHGTSHRYVAEQCAAYLGKPMSELKIITCHLGNGSSIAAVDHGKVVDTSMGFTPLAGLIMGTRCGDVDPSVITYLCEVTGKNGAEMSDLLNKESGLLGVSGVSSDNRDIETAVKEGNARAKLASEMLSYQIKKYIGSYAAVMDGVDAVVFTGGIGENASDVRTSVCETLGYLGVKIDAEKNAKRGLALNDLTAEGARVKTLVICTNEELMIARDTKAIVEGK